MSKVMIAFMISIKQKQTLLHLYYTRFEVILFSFNFMYVNWKIIFLVNF